MKRFFFKRAGAGLLALLLLGLLLTGCDVSRARENHAMLLEYNRAIESYNKLARGFTELAQAVDRGLTEGVEGEIGKLGAIWEDRASALEKSMEDLRNRSFQYGEVEACMAAINPLLEDMDAYLEILARRGDPDLLKGADLQEALTEAYESTLDWSAQVYLVFEAIYEEHILARP